MATIGALGLLVLLVVPVTAKQGSITREVASAADHLLPGECAPATVGPGGNLLVNGVPVPVSGLYLNAAILQAAEVLVSGAGSLCIDVTTDGTPVGTVVNAHIQLCGQAVFGSDGATVSIGGADLLTGSNANTVAVLVAAEVANVEACVFRVTVTNNQVASDAALTACLTVTQTFPRHLELGDGETGTTIVSDQIVDPDERLDIGEPVEVGLAMIASWNYETGATALRVTVVNLEGCGAAGAGSLPDVAMERPKSRVALTLIVLLSLMTVLKVVVGESTR